MQLISVIITLTLSGLVASAPQDAADGVIARAGHLPSAPAACASKINPIEIEELMADYANYAATLDPSHIDAVSATALDSHNFAAMLDAPETKATFTKLNATINRLEAKYGDLWHSELEARAGPACVACRVACVALAVIPVVGSVLAATCRVGCIAVCLVG